jgi:hypothetical protein
MPGTEPGFLGYPARSLVTISTELSRFFTLLFIRKYAGIMQIIYNYICRMGRSQWPCGLRRRSEAARLLRLWVRIPAEAWMSVLSVVCCQVVVSATG